MWSKTTGPAHVEREAVRADAAGDTDADRGDLCVADPDARSAGDAVADDAERGQCLDQRGLQPAYVGDGAEAHRPQIDDRVSDDLAGAVERDVAAAIALDNVGAERAKPCAGTQQVVGIASRAERVGRRMLEQDEHRVIAAADAFGDAC